MSPVRLVLGLKHGPHGWWDIHPTPSQIAISVWMFLVSGACLVAIAISYNDATKANQIAHAVQNQRHAAILEQCQSDKTKYQNSVAKLTVSRNRAMIASPELVVKLFRSAGLQVTNPESIVKIERAAIASNYAQTVSLLGTVLPHQSDCKQQAHRKAPR